MKKNLFVALFAFIGLSVIAQENVTKTNLLFGPLNGVFNISQERALNDRISLQASLRFMPKRSIAKYSDLLAVEYEGDAYNPFFGTTISALGNFTELRIYGKDKGALRGFYWGPYFHISSFKLSGPSRYGEFQDNDGITYSGDVTMDFIIKQLGGGLQIGVQWLVNDKISIDWTILGLGLNAMGGALVVEASNTSNNFDFRNYDEDVKNATFGLEEILSVSKTIEPTKVTLDVPRALIPHLKASLAIGFGY